MRTSRPKVVYTLYNSAEQIQVIFVMMWDDIDVFNVCNCDIVVVVICLTVAPKHKFLKGQIINLIESIHPSSQL